jgi:protein gp37
MADRTKIEWARNSDGSPGSTFNPWLGCARVGPGCDHCYAEAWAERYGLVEWGPGAVRQRTSRANWRKPLGWDRSAQARGIRRRVFGGSLCDPFDNKAPAAWRADLWALIRCTPHLDWIIVTKRIANVGAMLPADWRDGYANVWLLITVCTQAEADRDIPMLLRTPAAIRGLSMEPLLEAVNPFHIGILKNAAALAGRHYTEIPGLDWIIVGGESGPDARPMHPAWARALRDQCTAVGVPFFFKQWGEWAPGESVSAPVTRTEQTATWWDEEWVFGRMTPRQSEEQHRDDEPDLYRVGKHKAGRLLDGREYNDMPPAA